MKTIIIRHKKENLKKCSLRGLEKREDMLFFTYPQMPREDLNHYILLDQDAPALNGKDQNQGILLLDGTWAYAEKMKKHLPPMKKRSIPNLFQTAYPRKQTSCPNPKTGLASIEALYIAYLILNKNRKGLLDHYYWKDAFLTINEPLFQNLFSELSYSN